MPRSFELYLRDMLHAGEDIQLFLGELTLAEYVSNSLVRAAVERKFEIIGEALSQSRQVYAEERPVSEAERRVVDFRNRIIHGYFGVNDEVVWSAVKVYLPAFLAEVRMRIAERAEAVGGAS